MNYAVPGGHKGLIGWLNESGNILSGYKNDPKPKNKPQSKQIPEVVYLILALSQVRVTFA